VSATPAVSGGRPAGRLAGVKERLRRLAHDALEPLVVVLARAGVTADQLTVIGTALSVAAGVAFFRGGPRVAAGILIASGLCDMLDGQLARRAGTTSRFGAFLDSTLDRLADAAVLVGIAGYYTRNLLALVDQPERMEAQTEAGLDPIAWAAMAMVAVLALVGSFMVSYTRARAEGLGLECRVGWFERPERLVLLIVAGLFKIFWVMSAALLLLAVLSFWTAIQRVRHVWRVTRGPGQDG
jgi:CDP-diacylglycerol--glycerol-3-phosphate 3-phosphatidyltransferase